MAGFDDNLVREYFELNGFFTRTSAKPAGSARTRRAEEPGDLLVLNPSPRAGLTPGFQLFGADLAGLGSAVIAIKGLTASKALTPAMLRRGDFLEFIRKEATVAAKEAFAEIPEPAGARPARVLVLPGFPPRAAALGEHRPAPRPWRRPCPDLPDNPGEPHPSGRGRGGLAALRHLAVASPPPSLRYGQRRAAGTLWPAPFK